ncbi:MAG: DUF4384 domain-containing protein [Synergistaceae bacterium]|jgi:hypothetical protein|nr:DUF4384 domain-containing protein [Synergistaceae bacterium]
MKKVILLVLALSVLFLGTVGAFADVKPGATDKTRDIQIVEASEDPQIPAPPAAPVLNVQEIHKNDFAATLTTSSPNGVYKPGDSIVLTFTSEKDAYLTILDFTPSGNIIVLYPNDLMENNGNFVKAGEPVEIPVSGDGYILKAGERVGVDIVKAIATTDKGKQIYDEEGGNIVLAPPFSALKDTVSATRDILIAMEPAPVPQATSDDPQPKSEWSVASCAVMTDASDGSPNGFAVTEDGSAKIWTNGYDFLVGEQVFVHILSEKAGKVASLVNAGASSSENNMLPEGDDITFEKGQVLILPRPNDKWKFVASVKPGEDAINAKLAFDDGTEAELSFKVTVKEDDGE